MPIYVSRLSTWLEKRFNAKGGQVITDVDVTGRLVLPWQVGNEDRYLQGWQRFAFSLSATGGAGQTASAQIRNPSGSNVVLAIEDLNFQINAAATATFSNFIVSESISNPADLSGPSPGTGLDTRQNSSSVAIVSTSTNAGQLTFTIYVANVTGAGAIHKMIVTTNQELVLLPGMAIRVTDLTVAETLRVNLIWRERALELSELT